jgi:hypothetical protein
MSYSKSYVNVYNVSHIRATSSPHLKNIKSDFRLCSWLHVPCSNFPNVPCSNFPMKVPGSGMSKACPQTLHGRNRACLSDRQSKPRAEVLMQASTFSPASPNFPNSDPTLTHSGVTDPGDELFRKVSSRKNRPFSRIGISRHGSWQISCDDLSLPAL